MSKIPSDKPVTPKTTPKSDSKVVEKPSGDDKGKFTLNEPIETKPEIPLPL